MRYLAFPEFTAAQARNCQEAEARGCDMVSTRYWWPADSDPETGAAVLLIPEGDEGTLSAEERARLSDQEPAWLAERRAAALAAMGL